MIYTGSSWETLCTENITSLTAQEYFIVKNGIPFLPAFSTPPVGALASGTIYYSTVNKSLMIYNGSSWIKMIDLPTNNIAISSGFSAGIGVKTVKLPVLSSNPSPAGLVAGAFYINSISKIIRYFDGSMWQDISCQAVVHTLAINSITAYTAMCGGNVTTNGGSAVTLTGICWSTIADPDTMLTSKTKLVTIDTGIGIFTSQLTGLLPLTTYHVRAYAVNSSGVVYGEDCVFTTPIQQPTLITLDATGISSITAQSGGDISSDGGTLVTSRGIIYSSVSDPLTDFLHAVTNDGSGAGYFTSTLNGLLGNTVYYVRSFAVNSAGTAYGNLVQFTTLLPVLADMGSDLAISNITGTTATATTTVLTNGGALVTGRGVCISTDQLIYNCFPSTTINPTDVGTFTVDLSGLTPGTTYYVNAYADNSAGRSYSSEISFTTAALAHITTTAPSGLAGTTLNSGGNVLDDGNSVIISRGICWDTLPDPAITLSTKTVETFTGDGTGTFTSVMTGLTAGKRYYVRAYVISGVGVAYGQQEQITLPEFAKVLTLAASSLFDTTATVGGNVLSDGGSPVTERGVCWSTLPVPTYGTLNTSDGDGLGIYMSIITGLTPRSVYHYRAYAKTAVGISYGEDRTFIIDPDAPTIITLDIIGISSIVATSGGKITINGLAPITRRGIIWSTKGDPVDDPDQFITNDGSGVGEFPSDMKHLLGTTTYYVRAYAVNAYGTAYGNLLTFKTMPPVLSGLNPPTFSGTVNTASTATFLILHNGGAPITDRGICYYTTDSTNKTCVPSTTVNPLDIGTFNVDLQNLVPGTTYYVKSYATNDVGTAYSTETSFKTSSLPIVTTTVPNQIQGRSVYSGGTVFYVGDMNLQAHGVVWSTSPNPTIDLVTKTSESVTGAGTGIYTSYLSGLTPNTTYYVRAYAINSDGVGYGENLSFLTADYPVLVTTTPHSMTTNYAVLGGEIYSDGNSAVTERGVCYSTLPNPAYSDSHVADPEAAGMGVYVIQPFKNGNLIMGGLRENTKFYVRAYAVNSAGVAYGNLDSMMMQPSQLITYDASSITITSFTMSGTVNSTGYRDIGNKGFVWSTTNPNPTVSDNSSYEGYWAGGIGRNIFNLPTDTKYYYRVYAYTSVGLKYANVDSVSTLPSLLATITTAHPSAMASSSAVSGGTISFNGNTAITERGVCFSISPNPTLSGNHTVTGSGTGTFVTNLTNLFGSTKYYVRAYAVNTAGVSYGSLDSLVTAPPVLPAVSTTDAINIGSVTALGRGNVSDAGGATVSETGICWNLTGDPTIADNNVKAGSGTGNFSATLTGLTPVTRYYMRAYAVNKVGLAYGDVISFSTFTLATIVTSPVSDVTNITATGGGQISSDGGTAVTTSGICWNTTGVPTIDDSHTTGDVGIGSFIHSMSGLMGSITYYVRAYATNQAGTAYGQVESFITQPPVIPTLTAIPAINGSEGLHVSAGGTIISNGGGLITTEGLVWSTSPSFVPDTVIINRSTIAGSGNFTAIANRLQPGKTYYIRAYATNSTGTGYSDNVVSITTYDYPTVTTVVPDLSSVTSMSVQTGGNITSDGGTEVTENGLCWNVVSPPTISDSVLVNGVGTVSFIRSLTNLFGNTTYYVRAYAKNGVGVAYGQVETFTTLPPVLATITTLPTHPTSSTTATGGGNITTNGGALVTTRGVVWGISPTFIPDTVVVNRTATTGYFVGSFNSLMTGLQAGTEYYVRAYVANSVGVTYGELASFRTPNLPTIITNYAYPDGPTKGNVGVIITNRGGVPLSARGVVWSTTIGFNPDTVQVNKMSATTTDSIFEMALKNLKGATTYYVMGYATNIAGTAYGNLLSFNTDPAQVATLTTIEATSISWTSITSGGTISDNGGEPITTRGMIWSTTHGFRPDTVVVNRTATTGVDDKKFISGINALKVNTTYYARAYVANSIGIAYGNEISFITLSIQTMAASAGSDGYTGSGGGNIIGDANTAAPITNQGIIWSPAHDPTVALSTKTSLVSGAASTGKFYNEMAGLMPATTYYVRAYATTAQGIAYGNEVSFTTPVALPVLTTNLGTPISRSSVFTGGKISTNGNGAITAKGIIWSTNPNFNPDTVVVNRTMDGTGSANFTSTATGLQLSTSYYIRAYATNSSGTAYGNQVPVSIFPTAPMLNTVDPTAVTGNSATSGGIITMDGGSDVTLKGMCWATHSNPTVTDFKTTNGAGMGTFSQGLTGLQPNTLYYVRSYAVNSIGTGYGSEKTLLTNGIPTLTATYPATDIIATTATAGGKITDDGRSPILTRGIVWSIYSNPTILLTTKTLDDTTRAIGSFLGKMSKLQPNTTYYVRSYATNGVGTGYGSETTFTTLQVMLPSLTTIHPFNIDTIKATGGGDIFDNGGMPVTTRGICWSTLPNPTIALLTKINNATGGDSIYTNTMAGLFPGTKYYVRAYATNSKGTGYGNLDSLTTLAVRATVSNVVISHITQSASTDSASVITDGGAPVTSRGLCWNTTGAPTIADNIIQKGTGLGSFTDSLTSLVEGPTYYVRAFATNSAGTGYSPVVSSFRICPATFTVMHYAGLNGAPVDKTVTYHSVSSSISGKAVCWLTQNLGSDHQAASATDATEPSAGWHWQFNRIQGYKHDGTTRSPSSPWIASISENANWLPINDPCKQLLGRGWRIPTITEWQRAYLTPQNWSNYTDTYNSVLKLHSAGYLDYTNGSLGVGSGNYWSSSQVNATNSSYIYITGSQVSLPNVTKAYGLSVRCLRDTLVVSVTDVIIPTATMTLNSANGLSNVTSDGGSSLLSRGLCWNTTGSPTIADNIVSTGIGLGSVSEKLTGLVEGPTYYVRTYATNAKETTYSSLVTSFKLCNPFTVTHVAGLNGAPVTKTVTYQTVSSNISGAPRCWLTQNLGADHQATSASDATEASGGWYWQFNRSQGYQYTTTRIPASAWITTISENTDWMPSNDPCSLLLGGGWRIPTSIEWQNASGFPQSWSNYTDAYNSVIKLHAAGYLDNTSGTAGGRGTTGNYWSSTRLSPDNGLYVYITSGSITMPNVPKTYGLSLRCLRDTIVVAVPTVSDVSVPTASMTVNSVVGSASVISNGGATLSARGLCWNTTGNPTIADNIVSTGNGIGSIFETLTGLTEGSTYYVRAYATNTKGTAYSTNVTVFKICLTFTVSHYAGVNGVPVNKTVTYQTVSTNLTGTYKCWLKQNLGADTLALSASDGSERAAGWYWQFNSPQGYKHDGTTLVPAITTWIPWTNLTEDHDWRPENDPCNLLLGQGWRLPTKTEWSDVILNGNLTSISAFNSPLKIHNAGYLDGGNLVYKGSNGYYCSSTQYGSGSDYEFYTGSTSSIQNNIKTRYGWTARCLRDSVVHSTPVLSIVDLPISLMTMNSASGTAFVTNDGGSSITARGLCWNTTGTPTILDSHVSDTNSTLGSFTEILTGLVEGPTYFVRAYAKNSKGTSYSSVISSFKICPKTFVVNHYAGVNGAPVTKTVTYQSISSNYSGSAKCWITQNLGATQQATSASDATEASAGWYWQFNTPQGYKHDGTTLTPAISTGAPWSNITENHDWRPENDPCNLLLGLGWRLPTITEWTNVLNNGHLTSLSPFDSSLKIHNPGYLNGGGLVYRGTYGYYCSSSQMGAGSDFEFFSGSTGAIQNNIKTTYGWTARCLRDTLVLSVPFVSTPIIPSVTMTNTSADATSSVVLDGGSTVTDRGFCWNKTGNPTITDTKVAFGNGNGTFTGTIPGLVQGPTYFVRAYATNSKGTGYSLVSTNFKICPTTFTVNYSAGVNGAPVSKIVTYHSVSTTLSGSAKCWLTQNLGADQQAVSATDALETSAGWYWQFNRSQGFKQDGTTRTPASSWNGSLSENSNWLSVNDPCTLQLGSGWRIPTSSEWSTVIGSPQFWATSNDAYASILKLHQAGDLDYGNGTLYGRGSIGFYWSSTQSSNGNGNDLMINGSNSVVVNNNYKAYPMAIRCICDTVMLTVSDVIIPNATMTANTATVSAQVITDGGSTLITRGICWSTTGNPTVSDHVLASGSGLGSVIEIMTSLVEGPTYYVRAFATNSSSTAYSPHINGFKICNPFTAVHIAGVKGAPVNKTVTYGTVSSNISGAPRCWLTQNLGADQQATSVTDGTEPSAGWYWQFNKLQGYKNDGTTRTPSSAWISSITENSDWLPVNDPCANLLGLGWRLPTSTEWAAVIGSPQYWNTATDAYASVLKLHQAGDLDYVNGTVYGRGSTGYYWSSTQSTNNNGNNIWINGSNSVINNNYKSYPFTVRCLRDTIIIAVPTVSDVTVPTASMTVNTAIGSASVVSDGGATLTSRGLCWNSTGNPTISNQVISTGSGIGSISETLTGLQDGGTYYVRAYATNARGTAYSTNVTIFKICNPVTITHLAGLDGAPITKTVTYKTVGTNISGVLKCWLAQNLGANQQASSVSDATEASAGWYWQFNRSLGYKHDGTVLTPSVVWNGSMSENSDWLQANDPCKLLLGSGWRIPTLIEWTNADGSPQNWGTDADAYASVLKLHDAGHLDNGNGALNSRGTYGYYWSSNQNSTVYGNTLYLYSGHSAPDYNSKAYGQSVRCVCDTVLLSISDVLIPAGTITGSTAVGSSIAISDGGSPLISRGLCWNTTGNPTTSNNTITTGNGLGSFTETLTGLLDGTTYYVRGYATNAQGTAYSPAVTIFKVCNPVTITHIGGLDGAPVTKTVTYKTVGTNISGTYKCWLAQNLGSDQQAVSATDATEASSGWYWQFNRLQGYKHDGTILSPSVIWNGSISENTDWLPANDPCTLLLGTGWRIPTLNEWTNADGSPQNWGTDADAFSSVLKIHDAGHLDSGSGAIVSRGSYGYYSCSNQYSTVYGNDLYMYNTRSFLDYNSKAYGQSIRCVRDTIVLSVSDVILPTANMTSNTSTGFANVMSDGGSPIISRGLCWNTTGNPTISDQKVSTGNVTGSFSETLTGLQDGTKYYVRAFATTAKGTVYSMNAAVFKLCYNLTISHTAGINGAPVTKTVTYKTVISSMTGVLRCWISQNLGADQQAVSATDATEASAGWYWQFNRMQGYKHDGTNLTPVGAWSNSISESSDWLPGNDPCAIMLGSGWRIPTLSEWTNADASPQNWGSDADAYASVLKLHDAGHLDLGSGVLNSRGSYGYYWSGTQYSSVYGNYLYLYGSHSALDYNTKTYGHSVRCLCDTVIITIPVVSDILVPTATITANSAVITASVPSNGRATLTARGLCWNTTGTPTVADTKIVDGYTVTGTFSATMSGLAPGTTYYVRAFATNTLGTSYSPDVISFTTGIPMTVVSVTPSMGPTAGGTNVTITGTRFLGGNDSYTKLLLHSDGSGSIFTDSSPSAKTVTAFGNTTQSTSQSEFGGSSMYFDGSGDYLTLPTSGDFDPGTSDFTIDTWIYPTSLNVKIAQFGNAGNNTGYALGMSSGQISFIAWQLGGVIVNSGSTTVPINTWSHIALARDGQYFKIYINGTLAGTSGAYSGAISTGGAYNSIGTGYDSNGGGYGYGGYFSGYIDEFRFSKDVKRWTGSFTSPVNAYAPNPTVTVGGAVATNVSFVNSTTITASTPAKIVGPADVTVTNSDGQSATLTGGFTYNGPTVSSISPTSGLTIGGTNVMITGTNFLGGNDSYTKFLLHSDGNGSVFIDSSTGAKTVTANGNATQSRTLSKFGGSSTYFDGSGDYLTMSTSADFDPGISNFSIDTWIYPTASTQKIAQFGNAGTNAAYTLCINSGQITFIAWQLQPSSPLVTSGSTTVPMNTWSHVALARDGQYFKIYINGTLAGTSGAYSGAISTGGAYNSIGTGYDSNGGGYGYGGYFSGYIDEFRISKDVNRWTNNFTPPNNAYVQNPTITFGGTAATNVNFVNSTTITAKTPASTAGTVDLTVSNFDGQGAMLSGGFTYIAPTVSAIFPTNGLTAGGTNVTITGTNILGGNDSYTKLLLHGDGSGSTFTDSSPGAKTVTSSGNVSQSTSISKFGGSSAYFDGSGDYLTLPTSSDFDPGTSDFTMDAWIYPTAASSKIAQFGNAGANTAYTLYITSGQINFIAWQLGGVLVTSGSTTVPINAWSHVALTRDGQYFKIYINGTLAGTSGAYSGAISTGGAYNSIGTGYDSNGGGYGYGGYFSGYIDDFRFSKGIKRWTNNFTPPTNAYAPNPVITIGGNTATNVNFINSNTITADTPANTAGVKNVTVTNYDGQGGTLSGGFTYY